jgi:hypothetical protein
MLFLAVLVAIENLLACSTGENALAMTALGAIFVAPGIE